MSKNKYKYVSVAAMVAVMLLLGIYMWMTYSSTKATHSVCQNCEATSPWYHQ